MENMWPCEVCEFYIYLSLFCFIRCTLSALSFLQEAVAEKYFSGTNMKKDAVNLSTSQLRQSLHIVRVGFHMQYKFSYLMVLQTLPYSNFVHIFFNLCRVSSLRSLTVYWCLLKAEKKL